MDFQTITRSRKLPEPTNSTQTLWEQANALLSTRLPSNHLPVRLLGMGVTEIDRTGVTQQQLFDEADRERQDELDEVGDQIRDRYGSKALSRGSTLKHNARHRPRPT